MLGGGFLGGAAALALLGWPGTTLTRAKTVGVGLLYGVAMGLSAAAFKISPARFFGRAHLGAIQGALQTTSNPHPNPHPNHCLTLTTLNRRSLTLTLTLTLTLNLTLIQASCRPPTWRRPPSGHSSSAWRTTLAPATRPSCAASPPPRRSSA